MVVASCVVELAANEILRPSQYTWAHYSIGDEGPGDPWGRSGLDYSSDGVLKKILPYVRMGPGIGMAGIYWGWTREICS